MLGPWINVNSVSSVTQSCPTLCDPMDCSTPGFPVHHYVQEHVQTHVHKDGYAIQPSHLLLPSSPFAFNTPQHQSLFRWVGSSHEVARLLTLTTRHIQNWASFPHWHSCCILSGAISNCPLLFPRSILDIFWPGEGGGARLLVSYFLPFHIVHGVLSARILEWFAIPASNGPRLLELFTMTCSSWVALNGMVHSFTELHKPFLHAKAVIHKREET